MREKVKTVVEFRNRYHIEPPGTLRQILSHPTQENGVIELAFFQEHRYAFFFWNKWVHKFKTPEPPCLVSIDWHQDLCYPCETEKEWLKNLMYQMTLMSLYFLRRNLQEIIMGKF